MELTIKINKKQHLAYIPISLHQILGDKPKATPNRAAVLIYNEKTSISDVLCSLDIIRRDLEHARQLQEPKLQEVPAT